MNPLLHLVHLFKFSQVSQDYGHSFSIICILEQ